MASKRKLAKKKRREKLIKLKNNIERGNRAIANSMKKKGVEIRKDIDSLKSMRDDAAVNVIDTMNKLIAEVEKGLVEAKADDNSSQETIDNLNGLLEKYNNIKRDILDSNDLYFIDKFTDDEKLLINTMDMEVMLDDLYSGYEVDKGYIEREDVENLSISDIFDYKNAYDAQGSYLTKEEDMLITLTLEMANFIDLEFIKKAIVFEASRRSIRLSFLTKSIIRLKQTSVADLNSICEELGIDIMSREFNKIYENEAAKMEDGVVSDMCIFEPSELKAISEDQ